MSLRGRPPQVSRDMILRAAVELGVDRVTMRGLARQLGVGASTLYYHFENIDELRRAAGEAVLASLVVPDDDDWQAGLREISSTLRRHFEASTGMALEAIKSDQWPEWLVELHELGCARMVELGVPADAAWLAIRTVAEFVEGFVARQDVRRTSGTPLQQASLHRYPTLKRVSATLGEDEMEATFQFGLDAILAGLGALYPTR